MKKPFLILTGNIASFWSALISIRQSLEMEALNLITEQNSETDNFLTQIKQDLARYGIRSLPDQFDNHLTHNANSPLPEEISAIPIPDMDWMDEDSSQGGEFLDDALRIEDQP